MSIATPVVQGTCDASSTCMGSRVLLGIYTAVMLAVVGMAWLFSRFQSIRGDEGHSRSGLIGTSGRVAPPPTYAVSPESLNKIKTIDRAHPRQLVGRRVELTMNAPNLSDLRAFWVGDLNERV